jgi:tetratricopeptide (TPR) repeat protein
VAFDEALAVTLNQDDPDPATTTALLADFAEFESEMGNHARSLQLNAQANDLAQKHGNTLAAAILEWNAINVLIRQGDVVEAYNRCPKAIEQTIALRDPGGTVMAAETYAEMLSLRGSFDAAAELLGSAVAMRERLGTIRPPSHEANFQQLLSRCQAAAGQQKFRERFEQGRSKVVEDLILALRPRSG